jgi:hypothetical protein
MIEVSFYDAVPNLCLHAVLVDKYLMCTGEILF